MKVAWILLFICLLASCCEVDCWWFMIGSIFNLRCNNCSFGRKKRSAILSPCGKAYPQKFVEYDLNGNKKITLAEFAAATNCTKGKMSSVFDNTDTNDDGQIDKIEFQFASFYQGQKDHATVKNLKAVGEWISDAVRYDTKHGLKTMTFEITERKTKIPNKLKKLMRKKEDLFLDEDEE